MLSYSHLMTGNGQINIPGALHFVIGNIIDRIPIFKREHCCQAFIDELRSQINRWPAKLISWVLLPEHFHAIINPQDGDIKGFVRFGRISYIHANPVKAGIAKSAMDYRWSSFRAFIRTPTSRWL